MTREEMEPTSAPVRPMARHETLTSNRSASTCAKGARERRDELVRMGEELTGVSTLRLYALIASEMLRNIPFKNGRAHLIKFE